MSDETTPQADAQSLQKLLEDLKQRIAGVTGKAKDQAIDDLVNRYGPLLARESARLQVAKAAHNELGARRAQLNLDQLKTRAWLDAAIYGVQVQAHMEQAFISAIDFVLKVKVGL